MGTGFKEPGSDVVAFFSLRSAPGSALDVGTAEEQAGSLQTTSTVQLLPGVPVLALEFLDWWCTWPSDPVSGCVYFKDFKALL